MKRFYNIKLGGSDVCGTAVEVDLERKPESRLRNIIEKPVEGAEKWRINLIEKAGETYTYQAIIPEQHFTKGAYAPSLCVNSSQGYVTEGYDKLMMQLDSEGNLLSNGETEKGKEIFISEISKKEVDGLQDFMDRQCMLQLWV